MTRDEHELQRIADELGEPIEIVREMDDALTAMDEEGDIEARVDRADRARQAGLDQYGTPGVDHYVADAIDAAIETAMRVRITPEIRNAFIGAPDAPESDPDEIWEALRAAFRAAGFEVEQ